MGGKVTLHSRRDAGNLVVHDDLRCRLLARLQRRTHRQETALSQTDLGLTQFCSLSITDLTFAVAIGLLRPSW